jgi:hypothetical protein
VKPRSVLYYAGVVAAVAAALVVTLRLWERRMEVPFLYEGDGLFLTVLAKAVVQDGFRHFRHLGMPFGVEFADWGLGMPFDFAALRALAIAFGEPGTALNAWWLLSVVATGVFAAFSFRALDLGPSLAFGLGYLYALSPYAFFRNVAHIVLVYHFIPLIALLAIRTAEGRPERLVRVPRAAVLLGCAAQGLSYIYYSFFSCVLLGAAGALGWLRTRRIATLKLASAGLFLILIGTAVGLAPSLLYWREHGRIPDLRYKVPRESDVYALKMRHLLTPIPDHPFAPWRALAKAAAAAGFPDENENATARLGTVGSLGFLGLLAYAVGSAAGLVRGGRKRLAAAAALTLVSLLLAQVGGFGSLFNLLVAPDIRAYNRIFVFIAFFSLLAAGLGLERLQAVVSSRYPAQSAIVRGGVLLLLLLAVFDQASTTYLRSLYAGYMHQFDIDRDFVRRLESRLPKGAMVFQLPHTNTPYETVPTGMGTYNHGRAYLHSRSLRWSWGALIGRNANWQAEVQRLPPVELVRTLALAGFSGVWIDRFGYYPEGPAPPDGRRIGAGPNPETAIARVAGEAPERSLDGRYVFVSLESVHHRLLSDLGPGGYENARQGVFGPILVPRFFEGFGEQEGDVTELRRWCGTRGRLVLKNRLDREREVLVTAQLRSPTPRPQPVEVESSQFRDGLVATQRGSSYRRTAFLPARQRLQIHFSCPDRPATGPEAERCFELVDLKVVDLSPAPDITVPIEDLADEGN